MSEQDRKAALEIALDYILHCAGINPNTGGYKKRSAEKADAIHMGLAAQALKSAPRGIEWKEEAASGADRLGYDNIYQYIAGEYHEPDAPMMDRMRNAEAFEQAYRNGFGQLRRFLLEELGVPLYMVPYKADELLIRVITLYPDYPVKESEAYHVDQERERKRTEGQMRAMRNRQAARLGDPKANAQLTKALDKVIKQASPAPLKNPIRYQALEDKSGR